MTNDLEIYKLQKMLELEEKTADNMKRLNQMMLELKSIVAMVRPQVKKSGWYGDEITAMPPLIPFNHSKDLLSKCPTHAGKELPDFRHSTILTNEDC